MKLDSLRPNGLAPARSTRTGRQNPPALVPFDWHATVRMMLDLHRLVMLVGPPGCGKTQYVRAECFRRDGHEPELFQGTPESELGQLWGFFSLRGSQTEFCPGPLMRALQDDRALVVEEFNLVPWEVRASLLCLRGQDAVTNPFTAETIPVGPSFRLVATSNPESLACRRTGGIAQAMLDDFLVLEVPPLQALQVEVLLEREFPDSSESRRAKVVGLWSEYRELAASDRSDAAPALGYRAARHLMMLLEAGMEYAQAVRVALVHKFVLDPDTHEAAKIKAAFDG